MLHLRYLLVLSLLTLQATSVEPNQKRDAIYYPLSTRMDAARSNANAIVEIAKIARQAEQDYASESPDGVAMIFGDAAGLIGNLLHTDSSSLPTYYEMLQRQRMYIQFVPFFERFHLLYRKLPLNYEYEQLQVTQGATPLKTTELDFLLETWRDLNDKLERTKSVDHAPEPMRPWPPPSASWPRTNAEGRPVVVVVTANTQLEQVQDPVEREQFRAAIAAYHEASRQKSDRLQLRYKGSSFTNVFMQQIAHEYGGAPHLVAQLQEVMDGYLPPEISTNAMNKVFEAMRPAVAAKTPRPVPGVKGERWIRAAAPSGPIIPAVAKPSKIRDGFNQRPGSGAVASGSSGIPTPETESTGGGAAPSGSPPVWPWAVLGLAALAGGWVWVKSR